MKPAHVAFLVACGVVSGCGGAPQHAPASAQYSSGADAQERQQTVQQQPGSTGAQQPGYGQTMDKDAPTSMPQPPQAGATARSRPHEERDYAQPPPAIEGAMSRSMRMLADDLVVAESAMLTAGHDCTSACRALRSMQRAAARLCSLAVTDDEREVCRRSQDRVRGARERVRSSCGQCTGGPSLDPNAPIEE